MLVSFGEVQAGVAFLTDQQVWEVDLRNGAQTTEYWEVLVP